MHFDLSKHIHLENDKDNYFIKLKSLMNEYN